MGIKNFFKKQMTKGAMRAAQTKTGQKVIQKQLDKKLAEDPNDPQAQMARQAMTALQNMSEEERNEITTKMTKLAGGNPNASPDEIMKKFQQMGPDEQAEYRRLAEKLMGKE